MSTERFNFVDAASHAWTQLAIFVATMHVQIMVALKKL
jgi:hypothetical protein